MPAMFRTSIQLVACAFDVATDCASTHGRLSALKPSAVQEHPILRVHHLTAVRTVPGASAGAETRLLRVEEDDVEIAGSCSEDEAVSLIDRRMHELALEGLADRTKLHAGCGVWSGTRFLVVGAGHAGKTTLMTRLLVEPDCRVEGDELVLLRDGEAVAYPRRFGVRRMTLSLVPRVGAVAPELVDPPGMATPGGFHVLALDPAQLDVGWTIGVGPVSMIFVLAERRTGDTRLEACSTSDALPCLFQQSAPPATGHAAWVRDVSATVANSAVFRMSVGELDSAVRAMRECVQAVDQSRSRPQER
jgi:hypothetical protein